MKMNVREFFQQFPDDQTCLAHLFEVRFGQGHVCPKCEREAKWYPIKAERAYSCQWCGHHLHPTVGTPFEASRTPLQLWFYAIFLFTTSRHGVPAKELERQLGVTYKCAWRMGHEIRKHMADVDGEAPLSGTVEVDETFVGGYQAGARGRGSKNKTIVMGMMQRDGDVMTKIVPNTKRTTLETIIVQNVDAGAEIHTDEHTGYKKLSKAGYTHRAVNHSAKEYVRGNVHTNGLEGYWSRLKQSIGGTHIHVSGKHLEKYAKEFEYRFNARKNPSAMLPELLSTFGKAQKR